MGLLSKIKNALFEEEVVEEQQPIVAKQVEFPKEEKKPIINNYEDKEEIKNVAPYEKEKTPIIFDVEDFIEEKEEVYEEPKKEEKPLYGGYEVKDYSKEEEKDKFRLSPVISPIYGIVDKEYKKENHDSHQRKPLDHLFVEEKKKPVDFDTIRQKAYGYGEVKKEPIPVVEEDTSLLYEMQEDEKPGIEKISLGDAEEYFDDLGLEYNVDYTDLAKEKMTRSKKNKNLTDTVEEEIKENKKLKQETVKIKSPETKWDQEEEKENTAEEKNLYDLIDMMYDEK